MIRRILTLSAFVFALCGWTACGSVNPPPMPPGLGGAPGSGGATATGGTPTGGAPIATGGASAGSRCQRACANLARLGCPEDQATCVDQCELLVNDTRFTLDLDCRINATTKTAAQACGIASCK